MIALVGAAVCLRAGYRYDRSIGRPPLRSGVKRTAFWVLVFAAECLVVPSLVTMTNLVVVPAVFAYVLAAGLVGPWVSEHYRRRAT
ncbi:hypothetical protein [Saccharothrix hoggarensis]|uniref:Uncharacterized protein n=1 Tax=Saccharothrix hoggarensis TaxID=913853 RepID=A0ABW3QVM9_9PSEU